MTGCRHQDPGEAPTDETPSHPLAPLSAPEIVRTREILEAAGIMGTSTRVSYLGLLDPAKDALARYEEDGSPVPRDVRVLLLDIASGDAEEVRVSLSGGAVVSRHPIDPATAGQVPVLLEEHDRVREIVAADEGWCAALRKRGIDDPAQVFLAALSAGRFSGDDGRRRTVRVLAHWRPEESTMVWAHPVDGLVAHVDLIEREVVEIVDTGAVPIPQESGDYDDPEVRGPLRTSLRPIEITQPEGPSFAFDGHELRWENWTLRVGFDMREGLVLHQVRFRDGDRDRPVLHRASVAEMVVPYADPGPIRFWQNYFDTGEYQLGRLANSLELGCDCLGEITYLDAVVANGAGEPVTLTNAVCVHEEDAGVLWKHTDPANRSRQTRRQRRLVVSFFTTVGNYDYGFYWYLYLDGTIELECKATGVVFTARYDERIAPHATEVAPGLAAPYHQHLFNVRLDMAVDGPLNAVDEVEVERVPIGPDNPHGNAFRRASRRLRTEGEAVRMADPGRGRVWHVVNPDRHNRFGRPTGYELVPQGQPVLLADESSAIHGRAGFATRHLWVTRHDEEQRYPAGDLVNQSAPGAGLPEYAAADRPIDGADLVVWHTFGLTHFPRPEDWPVMPVDSCGFTLRPAGFFDRNPTLDVPPPSPGHCSPQAGS
ncbi:primary-amine oxidase [Saccharopolyspora erythraea]|uniref:primary-amine oxidase n=1 Tax=Saccharopolyspora erythraea TaxID=1836 RepID=UPI001BAE1D89|nr:primary-amine oxidase [Saccharopolyspora erythraea]QUH04393.1 primary-amine oxidase [Saccharopolyspora erythraea]